MPALILLVDVDRPSLQRTEALLSDAGYLVATVSSFGEAKELLDSVKPDLLIATIRLQAFNGLHLAARSRIDYPNLPVIVTHTSADPVFENEAKRQGAKFVSEPLTNPEFLPTVRAALDEHRLAQPRIRRWPRKRVPGTVKARLAAAEARVLDMSYGGFRLAFGGRREVPSVFDVTLPTAGITVKAHRVWTSQSPGDDEFWCGAELADSETPKDWRIFVDSVNA